MRTLALLITFGLIIARPVIVEARQKARTAKPTTSKSAVRAQSKTSKLETDVKFDDAVLHGQYQIPLEAVAKVENEKVLSDLLGIRKHFKDRLLEASDQE